jgi:hypothetical protein
MSTIRLFAHEGEAHGSTVESASHILGLEPVAFVVFTVLGAILLIATTHLLLHKPAVTMLVALALMFVVGVFSYSVAPVIAAICIIAGFTLSLALAFIGIVKG